jgi:thioredoxin reductase (NADPH)
MAEPRFVEGELRVIGSRWSPRVHAIKDFLARSRVTYRWLDVETEPQAQELAERAAPGADKFPIVLFPDGTALVDPDVREVAARLGLDTEPDSRYWDLIVVGGGPAGVTASIYAASDGLRTVVVEQGAPGGQISYSGMVENYPGFPEGLSGSELTRRAVQQAERFGVEILVTRRAKGLRLDD